MAGTAPEFVLTSERAKEAARDLGFELVGICRADPPESLGVLQRWLDLGFAAGMEYMPKSLPLRSDPATLLPGAKSVIACGLYYTRREAASPGHPRIASYALGRDYHKVLRGKLRRLASELARHNPEAGFRACVDSAPILEREYAMRAGLGWFGKNTCLIDSKRGSWFVIGLLLTSLELEPDRPAVGGCGTCTKCIDACPTGAIVKQEKTWMVDARRCVSYLTIEHRGAIPESLRAGVGDWTFGCDVCQDVCPFNSARETQPERAKATREPDFQAARPWPNLKQLAQISRTDWDELTRGSAVRRAGYEGLKRSAEVNLENSARGGGGV